MHKIFLVDDDEDDRMFTKQALESVTSQIEITELSDGSQLLALLKENGSDHPALVLMDMNMPKLNGLEALSVLRSTPEYRHIPVVMFSTTTLARAVKKAYSLGVNAYIVKPIHFDDYIRMAHAVNLCFLNQYSEIDPNLIRRPTEAKNVVIIEDNADHYALMELILKKDAPDLNLIHKKTADSALDFFSSLDKKNATDIDLIILDLYLPGRQQGLALLTLIRSIFEGKELSKVPIVVLSASAHPQDIKESYRNQANAYLIKTTEPERSFSYLSGLCYFWWNTISPPVQTT